LTTADGSVPVSRCDLDDARGVVATTHAGRTATADAGTAVATTAGTAPRLRTGRHHL